MGDPTVESLGDEYRVTFALRDMPISQSAAPRFVYSAPFGLGASIETKDVFFYAVPPESIGTTPPPCPSSPGPGFAFVNDPSMGLILELFSTADPALGPVVIDVLQWALLPEDTVPPDNLEWGDPILESINWSNLSITYPVLVYSGTPPIVFDLPDDQLIQSRSALLRYVATSPYVEQRLIWEGIVLRPIKTDGTTWGRLKAIYE
jgi:hypothetical protein